MKRNKFSTLLLALMLLAGSHFAIAQNNRKLGLDEAVKLSLQNNKQLKLSKAKVDEAVASTREAWNNHLPDVKISGAYLRLQNPTIDLKLKLGGSSTDTTKKSGGGTPNVNQAAYGMLSANLPLFSGFRIKYGVESAKFLEQAARLDADNNREEVVINTISAYINLYKAVKSAELVNENLNQQKQRVTDFTNLEKNGLLARNDLLKAQLQQANIELTLLDATNNVKMASVNMALMLGLPENNSLIPQDIAMTIPEDMGTIETWEITAAKNRKDMASLSYREKAGQSAIKATKGEYFPGIALTGGYVAADIPNVVTITNALNIGLGLQYNMGTLWKTGAKVAQAEARLHEVTAMQEILDQQVRLQIHQAYENCLLSFKKIEVYARAVGQATENYRITKNKYNNNLVTTTDLLEADVAQLQAQLNFTFAQSDAFVTYKKLEEAAGTVANGIKDQK